MPASFGAFAAIPYQANAITRRAGTTGISTARIAGSRPQAFARSQIRST